MESQNKRILDHLSKNYGISQLLAAKMFGCWRLSARIKDLRNEGHSIKTEMVTHNKKRFALYTLEK